MFICSGNSFKMIFSVLAIAAGIIGLLSQAANADGYPINQNTYVVGVPSWDVLNIRKWPATRSRIVGAAQPGARVWVERCIVKPRATDWCKISWRGQYGWVNSRFLDMY